MPNKSAKKNGKKNGKNGNGDKWQQEGPSTKEVADKFKKKDNKGGSCSSACCR